MAGLAWRRSLPTVATGSLAAAFLLVGSVSVLLVVNPLASLRLKSESEAGWYQASYSAPMEATAQAGDWLAVPVEVANAGVRAWVVGGNQPFVLSYHLRQPNGRLIEYDGVRTPLPQRVAPGGRLSLQAVVRAPAAAGEYLLEWDMLQEDVTWFSAKGNTPAVTRLTVVPYAGVVAGQTPQPGDAQDSLRISLGRGNPGRPVEAYNPTWQLALLAALTAWYVHGMLDSFYEFAPSFVAFWIIAGLALSWPIPPISTDPDSHATGI